MGMPLARAWGDQLAHSWFSKPLKEMKTVGGVWIVELELAPGVADRHWRSFGHEPHIVVVCRAGEGTGVRTASKMEGPYAPALQILHGVLVVLVTWIVGPADQPVCHL
jgi:hypothetical protein